MKALEIPNQDVIERMLGAITKSEKLPTGLVDGQHSFEVWVASTPKGEVLIYGGESCSCLHVSSDEDACDHFAEMFEIMLRAVAHNDFNIKYFYDSRANHPSECLEHALKSGILKRYDISILSSSLIE